MHRDRYNGFWFAGFGRLIISAIVPLSDLVNIDEGSKSPILPFGHQKYGGFSANDIPLIPMILPLSTAILDFS